MRDRNEEINVDYEADIKIEETALDLEWLNQPSLMMKYARHYANMEREYAKTKENLDLVKANLDRDVRENPKDFGLGEIKITEAVVTSAIISSEEYKKANQKLMDVNYELTIAKNALRAFEQRKDALENLVRLHGQQYFAGPKNPLDISREWQGKKKQEIADKSVNISRRGR